MLDERSLTVLWGTTYPLDRELAYAPIVAAPTAQWRSTRRSSRCSWQLATIEVR